VWSWQHNCTGCYVPPKEPTTIRLSSFRIDRRSSDLLRSRRLPGSIRKAMRQAENQMMNNGTRRDSRSRGSVNISRKKNLEDFQTRRKLHRSIHVMINRQLTHIIPREPNSQDPELHSRQGRRQNRSQGPRLSEDE
jgi:hypothetical protein